MKARKLPKVDSIHELANFWDSHDLTDFENSLEEVHAPVFTRSSIIKVPLQAREAQALQRVAESKGIAVGKLLRDWVVQKLARRNGRGSKLRKGTSRAVKGLRK
jgi:hypothetical protein